MRSDALQRRFLVGPLVALALLGPGAAPPAGIPVAVPTSSGSPSPRGPVPQARETLVDALEAQQVYYVDHLVFAAGAGGELEELRGLDPSIAWGETVTVVVPSAEFQDSPVLVLRAPLPGGDALCLALVTLEQDAGLWYARASAEAPCPKARAGMRGWGADESVWGS